MTTLQLQSRLAMLPPERQQEAMDFIEFLLQKSKKTKAKTKAKAGLAKGLIKMKPGFDDPLEDFKDYM